MGVGIITPGGGGGAGAELYLDWRFQGQGMAYSELNGSNRATSTYEGEAATRLAALAPTSPKCAPWDAGATTTAFVVDAPYFIDVDLFLYVFSSSGAQDFSVASGSAYIYGNGSQPNALAALGVVGANATVVTNTSQAILFGHLAGFIDPAEFDLAGTPWNAYFAFDFNLPFDYTVNDLAVLMKATPLA